MNDAVSLSDNSESTTGPTTQRGNARATQSHTEPHTAHVQRKVYYCCDTVQIDLGLCDICAGQMDSIGWISNISKE